MAYQTLDNFSASTSTEGIGMLLVYVANIVPIFIPLVLFALFIITAVGSFMFQEKFKGRGDIAASATAASVLVFVTSIMITLIDGLINLLTIVVVFVWMVICVIFLFITKE